MSHEIKTPLNAIIGYSQILREDAAANDPASLQDVNRIHDAGQYLLRLVNMILDLSKLEAGRMQFDVKPHAVRDCVNIASANTRGGIEANGNTIVTDFDPELDVIDVDENRFRQVLGAILENAGQHTKVGLVTVIVRRSVGAANTFFVRVTDTGSGISPEVLATIFETFQATRDAASGRFGGTGTNLTVVHRLCTAMGGSITAESMVGIGCTFTITLPVMQSAAVRGDVRKAA
jgi:signal transduction histidine kinase